MANYTAVASSDRSPRPIKKLEVVLKKVGYAPIGMVLGSKRQQGHLGTGRWLGILASRTKRANTLVD